MIDQILKFSIRADASQATGEIKKADTAVSGLGKSTKTTSDTFTVSEKNFLRVSKSLGVDLSTSTQRAIDKLQGLKSHLIASNAPASDLERVNIALKNAQEKLGTQISDTTTKMGFWNTHGRAIATTASAMGGAILAFGAIAIDEFAKSEKVVADLDAALASTGSAAGITKDKVLALSDELSKVTPFDDEVITQAQTLLITFGDIGDKVLPAATEAALNLATRFGTDVASAARTLGKALSDPEKGLTALNRLTGKFTEEEIKAIKEMVTMNDKLGAQNAILDKLEIKLGGAARAAGDTFAGKLTILRTQVGNVNEEIGRFLVPYLDDLISQFPAAAMAGVALYDSWGKLGISGGELLIALPLLKQAFGSLGLASIAQGFSGIILALTPFAGILAAATLALGAFYIAYRKIGQERLVNENLEKTLDAMKAITDAGRAAGLSAETMHAFAKSAGEAALKVGETKTQTQIFQKMVEEASKKGVKPLTGDIKMWVREQDLATKSVGSHVITLQEQINKQRALIAQLSTLEGKDEQLTDATEKLQGMLKKQKDETQKLVDQQNKLITATGALTPKLKDEIRELEKGIQLLKDTNASAGDVERASYKLKGKIEELSEAVKTDTDRFNDWQTSGKNQFNLLEDLVEQTNLMRAANIALANTEDPMISNNDTLIKANDNVKAVIDNWDKFTGKVEETPAAWEPVKQTFTEFGEQVSTIFTDFSKGLANVVLEGKGLGALFKEIGKTGFRSITEELFKPMHSAFEKIADKVSSLLSKAFDTAFDYLGGLFKNVTGSLSKLFGGGLAGGLGAGGLIGGAAIGAGLLINRLTRRGKEKVTATGAAEDLSATVWQDIVPMARAGTITVEEGISQLNAAWAAYEQYLKDNLKDQTVIQRSITTQRVTLDQGLAALNSINRSATAAGSTVDAVAALMERNAGTVTSIKKGFEEFQRIGSFSTDFFTELANIGFAREGLNIRSMSQEIARTKDLREEFAGLRTEIQSLLPKQKNWMELFLETGEITEELSFKIRQAGGDIKAFKTFADMRSVQTQFDRLQKEFEETGVVSQELLNLMRQYGSPATLAAFENLKHSADLQGQSMLDLAADSEASAKVIEDAFGSSAQGVSGAFQGAAQSLNDELGNMDNRLVASIEKLEASLIDALNRIIVALGGIPIAVQTNFDPLFAAYERASAAGREIAIRAPHFAAAIPTFGPIPSASPATRSAGATIGIRAPRFAEGGIVTGPTLAMIGERGPEAVVPLNQGMGGIVIERMTIVSNDPQKWAEDLKRMVQNNRGDMKRFLKQQLIGTS